MVHTKSNQNQSNQTKINQTKPTKPNWIQPSILKDLRCPKVQRSSCTDPYLFFKRKHWIELNPGRNRYDKLAGDGWRAGDGDGWKTEISLKCLPTPAWHEALGAANWTEIRWVNTLHRPKSQIPVGEGDCDGKTARQTGRWRSIYSWHNYHLIYLLLLLQVIQKDSKVVARVPPSLYFPCFENFSWRFFVTRNLN